MRASQQAQSAEDAAHTGKQRAACQREGRAVPAGHAEAQRDECGARGLPDQTRRRDDSARAAAAAAPITPTVPVT